MGTIKRSELPPGPKAKIPLGHLFDYRKDSISFLKKIADQYGDVVHFRIGPIRIVLLNHPDHIREVLTVQHSNFVKGRPLEMAKELLGEGLLTSEGEFHKRQSRMIQPAFHRKMIDSYASAMTGSVARLMQGWSDGMQVDMKEEMTRLSMIIAGQAFFKADVETEAPDISKALDTATSLFGRVPLPFSKWVLKNLPLPSTFRFYKAKARLYDTVNSMISERRRNKLDNGDLASLLLRAYDETGAGQGMSDKQVRDEALTLFLTAFDTTSTALTWTWYLLSQNPGAEAELLEELDRELGGRLPTAEDIPRLRYTKMVFGESLRIYPPSYVIPRQALEDFTIDRYRIPGGTIVLMSPYLIHHDPRFHKDPETFNPHAWDEHYNGQHSKYEFFPFGGGPRACIGEPFAWMQGVIVLASIAQHWRAKMVPGYRVELQQLINLRPKNGLMMTVHRRK
jgi:cytochrome P450